MKLHSTTMIQLINGLKLFNNPMIPDPARIITLIPPQNHVLLSPQNQINKPLNCDALPRFPNPQMAVSNLENTKNRKMQKGTKEKTGPPTGNHPKASLTIDRLSTDSDDYAACLVELKASHNILQSYRHAMTTDPDRWMVAMQVKMDTLMAKHTWDLVKPLPGTNIMDSMWIYNIKWDGEGN